MRLTCYGTGASEGIPALYCSCPLCENARMVGGKEIRSRHGSAVDEDIQFDLGPDFFYHIHALGLEPRSIRHLIITHQHADHYDQTQLANRKPPFALTEPLPLALIASKETLDFALPRIEGLQDCRIAPRIAVPYEEMRLDEQTTLTPLPAFHALQEGGALIYVLRRGGKALLYAHDTGPLYPEVLEWLTGQRLDAITLDCTGTYHGAGEHHLGFQGCEETFHALLQKNALKPDAKLVINHFSHGGGASHVQIEEVSRARGWIAAYDGLTVEI